MSGAFIVSIPRVPLPPGDSHAVFEVPAAKKPQLDVRKLKDEVAEFLKKQKFERAAEVLEQLVTAEPKDMSHRLKLGDAYRRMEQIQKAIGSYQHAAKFFADEGQLIKAIGAVKIILELDPRNADAQKQLAGVIDWDDVHLGDPAIHLMAAHLVLPPEVHAAFLQSYGPVDQRTWEVAKDRALLHAVLVIDHGQKTAADDLRHAGWMALGFIGETI